jgi:hypothetical protein
MAAHATIAAIFNVTPFSVVYLKVALADMSKPA